MMNQARIGGHNESRMVFSIYLLNRQTYVLPVKIENGQVPTPIYLRYMRRCLPVSTFT